jgi:hypothetical protein
MTYTGEVKNGVVVLKGTPHLADGTVVRVEIDSPNVKPEQGSAQAILKHAGIWADVSDEIDRSLEEIRQAKWEEVRQQELKPDADL